MARKRAYERPACGDSAPVLIDRLWPRGVRKTDAKLDQWAKEVAPSTALSKWFGHDAARWPEFPAAMRRKYAAVRGIRVEDIIGGKRRRPHGLTAFARVNGTQINYPAP